MSNDLKAPADLVRRLRETVRSDGDIIAGPTELDLEAATTIERLTAEREALLAAMDDAAEDWALDALTVPSSIDSFKAKMRSALTAALSPVKEDGQ